LSDDVLDSCDGSGVDAQRGGIRVSAAYGTNPHFDAILHNTILLLVPSLNPDGVDIVTQWYRKTLNTKWEGTSPPELWQKYVGHDNNRDWYIFSQPETRATISQLHNVWHPEIVYDVHQQGANASRMFIPPWLDPIEPNIDPILAQEMNMMGTSMASDLTAAGKVGIAIHAAYDFWTPSRHYQAFHGGLRILTESASARLATPVTIAQGADRYEGALGYDPRERSWNYLQPWLGGTWRCATSSIIRNWRMNRCSITRRCIARRCCGTSIRWGSIRWRETLRGARDFEGSGRSRRHAQDAGDAGGRSGGDQPGCGGNYVIPFQQPYSGYAKRCSKRQQYPNELLYPGGPPKRPLRRDGAYAAAAVWCGFALCRSAVGWGAVQSGAAFRCGARSV
jgi:hypothetical protein